MSKRVLDVGQCNADHHRISDLINSHFDVEIERAHTHDEAIQSALNQKFDLVLINRLLDQDGSAGLGVLASLKREPGTAETPVMLVSNYDDAQNEAVAAGAVMGFGKNALTSEATVAALGKYLDGSSAG